MESFFTNNWIFLVPFGLSLLYVIVQLVLGIGLDDMLGTDVGADLDVDTEIDLELDADVDLDADADAGDVDEIHWFDILGLGKAPLIFSLAFLGMAWGVTGMLLNTVIPTWLAGLAAFPAAVLAGRVVLPLVARLIPSVESYSIHPRDMIGRTATVSSVRVTDRFGEAHLKDHRGQLRWVRCVSDVELARGTVILLTRYDPAKKAYSVVPLTEAEQQKVLGEEILTPPQSTGVERRKEHE